MPNQPRPTLTWSPLHQRYELHAHGTLEQYFAEEDACAFHAWLEAQTSFAFVSRSGRISVLKETRTRGNGYWYGYRKQGGRTYKSYLGLSSQVTFARLEELAIKLTSALAPRETSTSCTREGEPSSLVPPLSPQEIAIPSGRREKMEKGNQKTITARDEGKSLLLSTRFSPPRLPSFLVERPSLANLEAICKHALTLVSASAGSGKTTLLATWAVLGFGRQAYKGNEQAIAWLSLDELDNNSIRFWDSVLATLRHSLPGFGVQTFALLHASQAPPLATILTALLNEVVLIERDIILMLDDYHLIEETSIHEGMCFLFEHLPTNLHLVLATRIDPDFPLSRFRVRGQIYEIRDQDLRFTLSEATGFLVQGMNMPLSEEDVVTLYQRTEGWIAGLHLAALAGRKREDLSTWISNFGGSHRYLLDYMQQEILAQLPNALQEFLLLTSVVSRMNAALCQAITASSTREVCQEMLEQVERANLFIVPLDEYRQWYRYHDLFREALQARLQASQPDLISHLHVRAARWYEQHGEWRDAIAHILAAHDYSYAADLMEEIASHFWLSGEASTVYNWVLALPDDVLRAHLRLALSATFRFIDAVNLSNMTLYTSMATQVEHIFIRVERLLHEKQRWALSEAEEVFIRQRLFMMRARIELRAINQRGDIERLRQLSQELDALPEDEEIMWKIVSLSFAYWVALLRPRASTALISRLREVAQRMIEAGDYQMAIRPKTLLAIILVLNAQFRQAQQQCLEGITLLQRIDGRALWEGHLYYSLFSVSYASNRLEEASNWLLQMLRVAQDWQQVELLVRGQIYSVRLALAKGDISHARQAGQNLEALVMQEGFALHIPWISTVRVQVWLAEGNLAEASAWASQTTFTKESWNPLRRCEVLMLVRVLLAQQQNVLAVETMERFRSYFEWPGALQTEVEWMALFVVALHRCRKYEQAIQVATCLLAITQPEDYVRLDLDTGEPLMKEVISIWLAAHPDEVSQAGPISRSSVLHMLSILGQKEARPVQEKVISSPFLENTSQCAPLSRREQQILSLLVAGQTYAEMAQTLVVSLNTIKTQISSIYRKLGVNRRVEAIEASQRLHLL